MEEYFTLKQKYEKKKLSLIRKIHQNDDFTLAEKREKIKNLKVPCVKCKRKVNTLFSLKDNVYTCKCGHPETPCGLNIEIKRSQTVIIPDLLDNVTSDIEELKTKIIKIKLDYLFKFNNESETVTMFEEKKQLMVEANDKLNALDTELAKILNTEERTRALTEKKRELNNIVQEIKKNIKQYMLDKNIQLIKNNAQHYTETVLPLNTDIRSLSNDINIVEMDDNDRIQVFKQKHLISKLEKEI